MRVAATSGFEVGAPVALALRPESIEVSPDLEVRTFNSAIVRVSDVRFTGSTHVHRHAGDGRAADRSGGQPAGSVHSAAGAGREGRRALERRRAHALAQQAMRMGTTHSSEEILGITRQRESSAANTFRTTERPPVFTSGRGAWLVTTTGERYLDLVCGSATSNLGHAHPAHRAALIRALDTGIFTRVRACRLRFGPSSTSGSPRYCLRASPAYNSPTRGPRRSRRPSRPRST